MAVIFNAASIEATARAGVAIKKLITSERVGSDAVSADRIQLDPGAEIGLSCDRSDLGWVHLLDGSAVLADTGGERSITPDHFLFMPPGYRARLKSREGATLFHASVADAHRFDRNWDPDALTFRCFDWTREPVLNSAFDARKRIYLLTPGLAATRAAKGEMIIYPPGTSAADHHHEGADHFQFILNGSATLNLNGTQHPVTAGDVVYIYANERHFFVNDGGEDLVFIEYFIPGEYRTVWADGAPICTWHPAGTNIRGGKPSREIGAHSSPEALLREDV